MEKVLTSDFFALFDLPQVFDIDLKALEQAYRALQAAVHPDRFVQSDEAQKRLAVQCATRVNEAYQTLKKPLKRALYLLELKGLYGVAESRSQLPLEFLMEQMSWRESMAEAKASKDVAPLESLDDTLQVSLKERYQVLSQLLHAAQWPEAAEAVRCLMFVEKLSAEVQDTLAELDD